MANAKKSTVEKATTEKIETIEKSNEPSQDITKILEMVQKMQEQIADLVNENNKLKEEQQKTKEQIDVAECVAEYINPVSSETVSNNGKIKVYHMQEMLGGLETYIKLTDTQRSLRKIGQVCTFTPDQFEELEGKYRHFFDKGIIALGAEHMDLAEMYDLPIYDPKTKKQYNSKVLKDVVNYSYDQLSEFYNNLSKNNQEAFLQYWLGKVYDKEDGYYNQEKMNWLETISGKRVFSSIIIEMQNNERRDYNPAINADK